MRIKTFQFGIPVSGELLHQADKSLLEAQIGDRLKEGLSGDLVGPRGGRYVPIGDIKYLGHAQIDQDFIRNVWTFAACRQGKYVRPVR